MVCLILTIAADRTEILPGAKVYICGRTEEKLATVAKTYNQDISGQIIPMTADISSKKDVAKLYEEIAQKENQLDILINNVSTPSAGPASCEPR